MYKVLISNIYMIFDETLIFILSNIYLMWYIFNLFSIHIEYEYIKFKTSIRMS